MSRSIRLSFLYHSLLYCLLLALILVAPSNAQENKAARIQNALSAAPASIARHATVLEWPAGAGESMTSLRQGTNGWTCLPDRAFTPANDPMCHDEAFMKWMMALMTGEAPNLERVGFSYMLQGGATASQSDPYAMEPAPGKDWIVIGPHVMMVVPDQAHLQGMSHDHMSGDPFTDFAGTPYEIIIVPLAGVDEVLSVAKNR